ncbi:LexA DNA binding domain-containing protein [Clostridium cavendishii DSM 21758]|uniref:LexA DNA binding domain-containing protein n=1 Tax=Clostridium cavendishii DSM 21758 TaxID=1121302 RepID=A0A1M6GIJ7_9CLOT|nr:hypothetical protein [Clostridium cavendishii]SHJ09749.1 LexA DNA binding domain-containing protein [Clostridium cavendishii DSM 21758]
MNLEKCSTEDIIIELTKRYKDNIEVFNISKDDVLYLGNDRLIYKVYDKQELRVILLKNAFERPISLYNVNKSDYEENAMTPSQEEIYKAIKDFININGYPPTIRELCDITGRSSTATVYGIIKRLKSKGFLENKADASRTLQVKKSC